MHLLPAPPPPLLFVSSPLRPLASPLATMCSAATRYTAMVPGRVVTRNDTNQLVHECRANGHLPNSTQVVEPYLTASCAYADACACACARACNYGVRCFAHTHIQTHTHTHTHTHMCLHKNMPTIARASSTRARAWACASMLQVGARVPALVQGCAVCSCRDGCARTCACMRVLAWMRTRI